MDPLRLRPAGERGAADERDGRGGVLADLRRLRRGDGPERLRRRGGGASNDPYGWNARWGYRFDREIGLYYCQARYYGPVHGGWLTRDPIGAAGGINVYGYCAGRPVGRSDPSGLMVPGDPGRDPGWYGSPWEPEPKPYTSEDYMYSPVSPSERMVPVCGCDDYLVGDLAEMNRIKEDGGAIAASVELKKRYSENGIWNWKPVGNSTTSVAAGRAYGNYHFGRMMRNGDVA